VGRRTKKCKQRRVKKSFIFLIHGKPATVTLAAKSKENWLARSKASARKVRRARRHRMRAGAEQSVGQSRFRYQADRPNTAASAPRTQAIAEEPVRSEPPESHCAIASSNRHPEAFIEGRETRKSARAVQASQSHAPKVASTSIEPAARTLLNRPAVLHGTVAVRCSRERETPSGWHPVSNACTSRAMFFSDELHRTHNPNFSRGISKAPDGR